MATQTQFASFLVPETVVREDGAGPAIDVSAAQGKTLEITLGITRIREQESLDVSIWGSPDGSDWGVKPLASFPQKFYCGAYSISLDLTAHPNARFLHAQWKMSRWGRGESTPLFGFCVLVEQAATAIGAHGH
jgi:hypothetical protein